MLAKRARRTRSGLFSAAISGLSRAEIFSMTGQSQTTRHSDIGQSSDVQKCGLVRHSVKCETW